ncbi:MAG: beta-L-arabinofuranosidase domain-containing protein [Armatimonadota bacterium]
MRNSFYPSNTEPLQQTAFAFLPLGAVKPTGWLKKQLRIQADGQTSLLPTFWDSLGPNSGWLGGTGESWERGPYYLDGLLPLAYLLDDEKLKAEAQKWIDWAIESQDEFGHFGPEDLQKSIDWWPFGIITKALTQYYEVSKDQRVIKLLEKFFKYMKRKLPANRVYSWAKVRWADNVLSMIWLYNRNNDPDLIELAKDLMHLGYDWSHNWLDFVHTQKQKYEFKMRSHVVNNAMGVKTPVVQWMLTGYDEHKCAAEIALEKLDTYHGTATEMFTGDEHLAGKSPTQGTEVCAVVEFMFSLENIIEALGSVAVADRLETVTYNALPGTFDELMKYHQYDQQANQVLCTIEDREWTNNRNDSNVFGLEPQYGCCTANYHQGWPKFVANMWMATPDDGLAAVTYGPNTVNAVVRKFRDVSITTETKYPFDETIKMTVNVGEFPAEFPLYLRIPTWAEGAVLKVNGNQFDCKNGEFAKVEREWNDGDTVELYFPMKIRVERRLNDAVALKRGPLVYSLKIGERWEVIEERKREVISDYAVYPTTDWNYGLLIDPENPQVEVVKKDVKDIIYGPDYAPIELKVKGKKIPEWQMEKNSAAPVPQSPVKSNEPVEELTLIPYGCAKLRITEFPLVEE